MRSCAPAPRLIPRFFFEIGTDPQPPSDDGSFALLGHIASKTWTRTKPSDSGYDEKHRVIKPQHEIQTIAAKPQTR